MLTRLVNWIAGDNAALKDLVIIGLTISLSFVLVFAATALVIIPVLIVIVLL